jgi:hypothetical protein
MRIAIILPAHMVFFQKLNQSSLGAAVPNDISRTGYDAFGPMVDFLLGIAKTEKRFVRG